MNEEEFWNKYEKFDTELRTQLFDNPNSMYAKIDDADLFDMYCNELRNFLPDKADDWGWSPNGIDPDIQQATDDNNTEYLDMIFWVPRSNKEYHPPKNTKQKFLNGF